MTEQFALLELPATHIRALTALFKLIPPDEFPWALTGSGSLRLQGVDVRVHDLDIQTDKPTIYILEQRLVRFMKTPVHFWESTGMHSLDGKAEIENIEIEILANILHKMPDGTWSAITDFSRLIRMNSHGLQIPLFPLKDELAAYEAMGRVEKAALIRKTLASLSNL
jgi:hypothetical protein